MANVGVVHKRLYLIKRNASHIYWSRVSPKLYGIIMRTYVSACVSMSPVCMFQLSCITYISSLHEFVHVLSSFFYLIPGISHINTWNILLRTNRDTKFIYFWIACSIWFYTNIAKMSYSFYSSIRCVYFSFQFSLFFWLLNLCECSMEKSSHLC